jgi:hypothetical protein
VKEKKGSTLFGVSKSKLRDPKLAEMLKGGCGLNKAYNLFCDLRTVWDQYILAAFHLYYLNNVA